MQIVKTTDGLNIGISINGELSRKYTIELGTFVFEIQDISKLDNGNILLSNPNYQIELEE